MELEARDVNMTGALHPPNYEKVKGVGASPPQLQGEGLRRRRVAQEESAIETRELASTTEKTIGKVKYL